MSSANDWKKQKDLLVDALALDAGAREVFLAESDIDPETRAEVRSLLELESNASRFLSVPASEFSYDFCAGDHDERFLLPKRFGIYEIVREIGAGGMGAVYLAERRDGRFSQRVAIKFLRRELDTAAIRKHFEREKDILAALSHPNIAGLLDAGESEGGIPYLVMEFIEGVPIDEFCEKHNLDLSTRLKLFNKICDGVVAAHRNLIVHRDIKPSNILVTEDGVPKLLDFGISKFLDADPANTSSTRGAMTPEYASPEQINGQPVTTATDVYSLGLVLYKMLTGVHPFERGNRTNIALFRAITEDEPPAPSAVSNTDALKNRGANVQILGSLKGDLDNIILKSIRKSPDRRYGSVEQLTADIWRYIDGKPVEARPATRAYRLSKFYQRNRIPVLAGAIILAVLIGGISVAVWQARIARASAAAAVIESDIARAEQRKAEKVSDFMMKIIRYANPRWYAEGHKFAGDARVIDALDDMASKLDSEFSDQPDVLAEIHHQFGDAYLSRRENGGKEKAKPHFERAFELRRQHFGPMHELIAKDMAYLYWVQNRPHPESSIKTLSDAIVMMRATNPRNLNLPYMLEEYLHALTDEDTKENFELYLRLAPIESPTDRYLAADLLFDEMLGLMRLHFAEDHEQIAAQKCAGTNVKWKANKRSDAEEFYGACVNVIEKRRSEGRESPALQGLLDNYERLRTRSDRTSSPD